MTSTRDAMKRRFGIALVAMLAATLAACDNGGSSDDGGDSASRPLVAGFNAVANMGTITFLREEERWSALEYGQGTDFRNVGADQYDLNFDTVLPGDETTTCNGTDGDGVKDEDECTRLTSTSINAIQDHEYVIALLGGYENLRVQVYDKEVHEFDTTTADGDPDDEDTEVQFFHWSDALPELDVYLERPGTNLSPVQARATLTSGKEWHGIVPKGDYVITLAPVANPSAAVYTSETFALQEQTRVAFAIMSGAGDGTSVIRIERFRDQAGRLLDRRVQTQLRLANVVREGGSLDVYADEDFTQPIIAGLAEGAVSQYVTIPAGSLTDLELDATVAGNPGVLLAREEVDLARGERSTFILFGSVGRVDGLRVADPFRRIATHAQLRMINTAAAGLDFFVVRTGSNINTLSPTVNLGSTAATGLQLVDPDTYDIILTRGGTDDVVFGPRTVTLAGGGIYTIVATGRSDLTSADAVLLDDFVQ
jgi:hypothetical protein